MTFSITSLIRLIAVLAISSTILAVTVSRFEPPKPETRSPRPITNVNINDYFLSVNDRQPRWLDSETGQVEVTPIVADDVLEVASCSPWTDESGRRQIVGRWSSRTLEGPRTVSHAFGLARYAFPGGQILDQIPSEIVPVCPPCWYPGTMARVLFVSGNGKLYRYNFESDDATSSSKNSFSAGESLPIPLTWSCAKPANDEIHFCDISWPNDPRMKGRLVASMRISAVGENGRRAFTRSQLWWLQLNDEGTHIVDCGPLVKHDLSGSASSNFDERSATVATLADGSLGLAYTQQAEGSSGWSVFLGPLVIDADRHQFMSLESRSRILTRRSHPAPLAFSTDGQWLSALIGDKNTPDAVVRFSTSTTSSSSKPSS